MVPADLLARARAGDSEAFGELVDPYRRELQVHCYRILGSAEDAEDMLQETLLAAWQALDDFVGRASIRTWLYRIATSRCLNALRSASRRPVMNSSPLFFWADPPEPTRRNEVAWLEPYPDVLLDDIAGTDPGPEARYQASEAMSLAFITALQLLPPRQRAVLILRDVLGFHAREVAQMLDTSTESVTSALKRARATLRRRLPPGDREPPPAPGSAAERALVDRLTRAFAAGDPDGVAALLAEDVWLSMPPLPQEYQGRDVAAQGLSVFFGRGRACRLVATRANGQPAFGVYVRDPHASVLHATGLLVVTLTGDKISAITRFDTGVLARFGLPRTLPTG